MVGRRLNARLRLKAVEHVRKLAKRYHIVVQFNESYREADGSPIGIAHPDKRKIFGPPIVTALDYLAHLHEIGHIASRRSQGIARTKYYYPEASVVEEGAAWAWAAEHSDPEIMAKMSEREWQTVGSMFVSYAKVAVPKRR